MRQALTDLIEHQAITVWEAARLLGELGYDVTAFDARIELERMVSDGLAEELKGKRGVLLYSAPSGGGYDPGGGAA